MLSSYAKAVSIVFHLLQLFALSSSASGGDSIPLLPNFRTLLLFLQLSNMMALIMISQVTLLVKSLLANAGDERDASSTPGSGRFPGGRHDNPLQYSCLENPMDKGAWRATGHGSQTDITEIYSESRYYTKASLNVNPS